MQIVKPKRMIAAKTGKLRHPLPGFRDDRGDWKLTTRDIAEAWQRQFGRIEHAEPVDFEDLAMTAVPTGGEICVADIKEVPSLVEFEQAIRSLNPAKAEGADGLGSELYQADVEGMAVKLYPLFLKMALRSQTIAELNGGWLLPLWKRKLHPSLMSGYRAILLEPTISRAFAKCWRSRLTKTLEGVAAPLQWGGRSGLAIESLHLMVRSWQTSAIAERRAIALIFIDIQSAFYSVIKPMIAGNRRSVATLREDFDQLGLPDTCWDAFQRNMEEGPFLTRASSSRLLHEGVATALGHSWFILPNGTRVQRPRTGSRPGDPNADVLFGFLMAHVIEQVNARLQLAGLLETAEGDGSCEHHNLTWVDDSTFLIKGNGPDLIPRALHALSIVADVMIERGMRLSYGAGKTAILPMIFGKGSGAARQAMDAQYRGKATLFTEHLGAVEVPIVDHYRHLGGFVTRTGASVQEIQVREACAQSQMKPLKKVLSCEAISLPQRW